MGCGCGGGKRGVTRRTLSNNTRQVVSPTLTVQGAVDRGVPSNPSPETLRALGLQNNVAPAQSRLDSDKRRIEKLRRDAVKKALNK